MARTKRKPSPRKSVKARSTRPEKTPGTSTGRKSNEAAVEFAYWQMGMLDNYKDQQPLNPHTILTYSVVWRCVFWIAQSIASLGWHVCEYRDGGGKDRVDPLDDDIAWLLDRQASQEMTARDFREVMLKDALTWGNAYAEIDRDGFGRPLWLYRISPDRVSVERNASSQLIYVVENPPGVAPTVLMPDRMFHVKGPTIDGLLGYSIVEMARRSMQLGMRLEQFGHQFFERGPMPGGILEVPVAQKQERDAMRKSFEGAYGGAKNAGRVVVVSGGVKFSQLNLPNTDSQFIESREFSLEEVCRWFGVPPHKVADLRRATFSNIEEQNIEAVQDCLLPWCRRLECEADVKLFGRVNRGRRWSVLNLEALLRGDSATQTDNVTKQVQSGLLKINEGRGYLGLNPDPDGDTLLIQGAMAPVERILKEPMGNAGQPTGPGNPKPPKPAQDEPPPPDGPEPPEAVLRPFVTLLAQSYDRLLRVEVDKAKRAANRSQLREHTETYYNGTSDERVAGVLLPAVEAFLTATGRDAEKSQTFALQAARRHNDTSRAALAGNNVAVLRTYAGATAERTARAELVRAWEATR